MLGKLLTLDCRSLANFLLLNQNFFPTLLTFVFVHKLGRLRNLDDTLELVCDFPKLVTSLSFSSVTDAYLAACLEG